MATRRDAREWALQMLFELDLNPSDVGALIERFFVDRKDVAPRIRAFCEELVRGVRDNLVALDEKIAQYVDNWEMKRIAVVDRNVLRMGTYEMLHCADIPPVVSINEAVDLAKCFSCTESGRFVNGILDRARKELRPGDAGAEQRHGEKRRDQKTGAGGNHR